MEQKVFGDAHVNVQIVAYMFDVMHEQIDDRGYNDALMEEEKNTMISYYWTLKVEESFWHDKARIKWCNEGDMTQFFHGTSKIRLYTKNIFSLTVSGEVIYFV